MLSDTMGAELRRGLWAALLLSGCAGARFEARYAECTPPDPAAVIAELGMASSFDAPESFGDEAASNYVAAPPWVEGQSRTYPWDRGFAYEELLANDRRPTTAPLWCEVRYQPQMRQRLIGGTTRRWLSADGRSGADLFVLYEVVGQEPPLRAWGPSNGDVVHLLDSTRRLGEGDVLRFTVSDRDIVSEDDHLADFELAYAEPLSASTQMRASGATSIRCRHLDSGRSEIVRHQTLVEFDQALASFVPVLEMERSNFGLDDAGMDQMRALSMRAASLGGWDDPQLRERSERALGIQLCFERAAVKAVASRGSRFPLGDTEPLRWRGITFTCASELPNPAAGEPEHGPCTLAVEATNDSSVDQELYGLRNTTLVLAGGREVDVEVEGPTVIRPDATVALALHLPRSVVADVPLTRPVLLRDRRWRLIRKEYDVIDHRLWPRG